MRRTVAAPLVERRPVRRPLVSEPGSAPELEADAAADQKAHGRGPSTPPGSARRLDTRRVLPGEGRPLEAPLRSAMESRLGADLGKVRVHDDATAQRNAEALSARAFSIGPDVAFGRGSYDPGSPAGKGLIAHELAHTLQPAGSGPPVRRQPKGPTPGGRTATVVELQGHRRFNPPPAIAEHIKARGGADTWVSVRFGDVASGEIPVYWGPPSRLSMSLTEDFQTPAPKPNMPAWGINFHHPAFRSHPQARPTLWINIEDSVVGGGMGWVTPLGLALDVNRFKQAVPLHLLFGGLQDFSDLKLEGEIVNSLWEGHFRYLVPRISFRSDPFAGSGTLAVRDAAYDLQAALAVPLPGLAVGTGMPVRADEKLAEDGSIFLRRRWDYSRSFGPGKGRLSGSLSATLGRGHLDIRGTAKYASTKPKVTGAVTIVVASMDVGQDAVRAKLGQAAPPPDPALSGGDIAITGWGDLDFALSEWITGRASVLVHPEGYVTASGELTPTKVVVLSQIYQKKKPVDWLTGDKTIPIAGFGKLAGFNAVVDWKTVAHASFGPATLHDMRLAGLVSTHPAIVNTFELSALISAPATAGLTVTVGARMATHLLTGEPLSAGVKGTGELELLMYAEAGAQVGRRAVAGAMAGAPLAEYYLKGHLDASAALVLRLALDLTGSVLFWEGSERLVDREWTLGQGGVGLGFEYVLGGKGKDNKLTTDFHKLPFDGEKFAHAVARRELVKAKAPAKTEADTKAGSDVPLQKDAPPAPVPGQPVPPPVAGSPAATRQLDEPFVMGTQQHSLRLELTEHPDVLMQSPKPTSLLWRIKRLRSELRKSPPSQAELQARLEDLATIEEQVKLVIDAAAQAVKDPKYLTPDIAGFRELAELIEIYGIHYGATDLDATLEAVTVDPDQPATILHKFPRLAARSLVVSRVGQILQAGVDAVQLRTIVDHHRPSEEKEAEELLDLIWTMMMHNIHGWATVTGDLAGHSNKRKGARFVLRYVELKDGWDDLRFEAEDPEAEDPSGRRWDAWMNGRLYEFKAWYRWQPVNDITFLKQILEDYHRTAGMPLRWVFGPGSMKRQDVLDHMHAALDDVKADIRAHRKPKVPGYTITIADAIKAMLNDILVKVD